MSSTKEGNNRFLAAEGEVVFTLVFQHNDKIRVLETHRGFCSTTVANCLVRNIVLPTDEKLNWMTCSELNQFAGGNKYKVSIILIHLCFDKLMSF